MMHRLIWLCVILTLAGCASPGTEHGRAAARFAESAASPPLLRAFLYRMPKGGDLHTHLSGAAYAEANIRAGAARGVCFDRETIAVAPCGKNTVPLSEAVGSSALTWMLTDAWSMRGFVPTSGNSGHDQFFRVFALFGGAASPADMAAEVVDRAGRQRMRYIELMITFQGSAVAKLATETAARTPWTGDMAAFEAALMQAGLPGLVRDASRDVAALRDELGRKLRCGTPQAAAGCNVTVRWLQQVTRTAQPPQVFAQTLFAALLNQASPHVVGLNFVAPEDHPVALADYTLHMHMIDHVHRAFPGMRIALHAGELTLGLVPPEHLLFHIRQAVETARASRIGHGVAVMYEDDPHSLLREMARRRIAVEINLTSNAQILGVAGDSHPFPIYRAAGVPVVISTDDEGIERVDRTHELQRAVTTYGLSWGELVGLERNTLEYAFLPGDSLWADPVGWRRVAACEGARPTDEPSPACATFLQGSEKARLQWSLERDLAAFDREAAGMTLAPR